MLFQEDIEWEWCKNNEVNTHDCPDFIVSTTARETAISGRSAGAEERGMIDTMGTPSTPTSEIKGGTRESPLLHEEVTPCIEAAPHAGGTMYTREEAETSSDTDGRQERYRTLADIYAETVSEPAVEDLLLLEAEEPSSYSNAAGETIWKEAMKREIEAIEENDTWTLTELPLGHKPIGLKWVYKVKRDSEGKIIKHKARVVAKGYAQRYGVDFDEVFAPVAKLDTVRVILAIAANRGWEVHHMDVKSAFLNGFLTEEVYVTQPEGFVVTGKEHMVYKLSKALYGLRQAPRAWNSRLDDHLKSLNFVKCSQEQALYTRQEDGIAVIVGVYVDDLVVTGRSNEEINQFKVEMKEEFKMSDLGSLSYYLGIEVEQKERSITLKQSTYANKILQQFGMKECNAAKLPMEHKMKLHKDTEGEPIDATEYRRMIGCLRYLLHTRPDLSYAVGVYSRYMERPTTLHLKGVKQILRYLKGTILFGLMYTRGGNDEELTGYSDSDLAGDPDDRKSTGGMAFYVNNNLVSWGSYKQRTVALSSCEAEYMAAAAAACQAVWLASIIKEITGSQLEPAKIHVDNNSAIALMKNPVHHGRSKHIDMRFHFIRECIERGKIAVESVSSGEQRADILTKALSGMKFAAMRQLLGIIELEPRGMD